MNTDAGLSHFYVSFKDGEGYAHSIEISEALFHAFNDFELDDLSHMNEADRHYEKSELTEETLNRRALRPNPALEDIAGRRLESQRLHKAISALTETQQRRVFLYFWEELTYEQIAQVEGCTVMPVKRSIDAALKKLKEILT